MDRVYSQADLDAAQRLFQSQKPTSWTYLLVLWHCHQALEKMLKILIIKRGKELLRIHDLPRLAKLSETRISEEKNNFWKILMNSI